MTEPADRRPYRAIGSSDRLDRRSDFVRAVTVGILFFMSFAVWSFASPVMSVPDEPAHAIKAASVWWGQLRGQEFKADSNNPGFDALTSRDRVRVPASYARLGQFPDCFAFRADISAACSPKLGSDRELTTATTTAGNYSPFYYVLVGWPTRFFAANVGVYLMRLTNALLSAALIALAFDSLRRVIHPAAAFIGIALAVTPTTHFLGGSVNPNGLEVAASIAFWCATAATIRTLKDKVSPSRTLATSYLLSGAVLVSTRSLGPGFAAITIVAVLMAGGMSASRTVIQSRTWWMLNFVLAIPTLLAIGWINWSGQLSAVVGNRVPDDRHVFTALTGWVDDHLRTAIAMFGWMDTGPVIQVILPWIGAVMFLVASAILFGRRRELVVLAGVLILSVMLPVIVQMPNARESGMPWQGRYGLALLVGVPLLATWFGSSVFRIKPGGAQRLTWTGSSIVAVSLVISHLVLMQRNVVGVFGPLNYLLAEGWMAPRYRVLLLTLTLVVSVGVLVMTGWLIDSEEPSELGHHSCNSAREVAQIEDQVTDDYAVTDQ